MKLNFRDRDVSEIIFTGGGSILEGFLERAEMILEKPAKMGFLYAVKDSHIQAQSALYATSVGLIHLGARNRAQKISVGRKRKGPLGILKRAKMLYEEYF